MTIVNLNIEVGDKTFNRWKKFQVSYSSYVPNRKLENLLLQTFVLLHCLYQGIFFSCLDIPNPHLTFTSTTNNAFVVRRRCNSSYALVMGVVDGVKKFTRFRSECSDLAIIPSWKTVTNLKFFITTSSTLKNKHILCKMALLTFILVSKRWFDFRHSSPKILALLLEIWLRI